MKYDGIVIGGGPAGMFAAITAAEQGSRVILLEKNDCLGKKRGPSSVPGSCHLEPRGILSTDQNHSTITETALCKRRGRFRLETLGSIGKRKAGKGISLRIVLNNFLATWSQS